MWVVVTKQERLENLLPYAMWGLLFVTSGSLIVKQVRREKVPRVVDVRIDQILEMNGYAIPSLSLLMRRARPTTARQILT